MPASSKPSSVLATWRAHLVVWAAVGLAWGASEAIMASLAGGSDVLTVLAFYPLVVLAAGFPLSVALSLSRPNAAPAVCGRLLMAMAVAVPLAVWVNLGYVRDTPLVSLTNLGVVGGAALVGLLLAWLSGPVWDALGRLLRRPTPNRRLGTVALVALLLCAWRVGATCLPDRPGGWPDDRGRGSGLNLIVVVLDTLRADHLSCYGYERETTPRLDALPGVRFERAYAQAHWTVPSTASLLTGLYPSTHGTTTVGSVLPEGALTLCERLHDEGFVVGFVTGNMTLSTPFGFTRGADWVVSDLALPQYRLYPSSLGSLAVKKGVDLSRADSLNARALPFLETVRDRRFFLYLQYMDPHHPYDPPRGEHDFDPEFSGRRILDPSVSSRWPISERERENLVARYDGEIRFLDAQIGELLDELERLGLRDETLVVVTSDHGEEFHEHGGWIHGHSLYEEMIRVPLIVSDPRLGRTEQVRAEQPVRLVDVVPTLLELLGLPVDPALQGESFSGLLKDPDAPVAERPILSEGASSGHRALVSGGYKLIQIEGEDSQLYDMTADPGEQDDLAASHPEIVRRMTEQLQAMLAPLTEVGLPTELLDLDAAEEQALRQLGYVK